MPIRRGAFSHPLGAEFGIGHPLLVDPLPAVPPRRGHLQEVPEFLLPLDHQRFGDEDEDRFVAEKGHQLGGEGQLHGLPQTHLIGQKVSGAAILMGVEGQFDEGFLVRPETVFPTVDGQLHNRFSGFGLFLLPGVDIGDNDPVDQPGHILHDRLRSVLSSQIVTRLPRVAPSTSGTQSRGSCTRKPDSAVAIGWDGVARD